VEKFTGREYPGVAKMMGGEFSRRGIVWGGKIDGRALSRREIVFDS